MEVGGGAKLEQSLHPSAHSGTAGDVTSNEKSTDDGNPCSTPNMGRTKYSIDYVPFELILPTSRSNYDKHTFKTCPIVLIIPQGQNAGRRGVVSS